MNGLVEFLKARLDEDEADAGLSLRFVEEVLKPYESRDRRRTRNPASSATLEMEARAKRILAEAAAKRAIVERCVYCMEHEDYGHWLAAEALRLLAQPYRDHPDYRQEWAA